MIRTFAFILVIAVAGCASTPAPAPAPAKRRQQVSVAIDTEEGRTCLASCKGSQRTCNTSCAKDGAYDSACIDTCEDTANSCKLACPDACWANDTVCNAEVNARIAERKKPKSLEQCFNHEERGYNQCLASIKDYQRQAAVGVALGGDRAVVQMEREVDRRTRACEFNYSVGLEKCRTLFPSGSAPPPGNTTHL